MGSKLVFESTEVTERFVDVTVEGAEEIVVTAKSFSADNGREIDAHAMVEISVASSLDEGEDEHIMFAMARWEDVKRMGDAAIAAFREKFAGPS